MGYNWQQPDWPEFRYDLSAFQMDLYRYAEATGRSAASLPNLSPDLQEQAILELMVIEAMKTSAIEGEYLEREDVMSSIRNHMHLNSPPVLVKDSRAHGIAQMMVHVRQSYNDELNEAAILDWHRMLFSTSEGEARISVGAWRTHEAPMQVVSGQYGKIKVHFEAPPSKDVTREMTRFIDWFNRTGPKKSEAIVPGPVRAAVAHLYFESIHPFEDGNGRIGRALAEKALSQGIGQPALISLSQRIESKKKLYYEALKKGQESNEITTWIGYFIQTVLQAQQAAERLITFTLTKARFFDRFKTVMNNRQQKVISRMLREGPEGFQGGINATKYTRICHCSKATATRDLADLRDKGILIQKAAGGRSTSYTLSLEGS